VACCELVAAKAFHMERVCGDMERELIPVTNRHILAYYSSFSSSSFQVRLLTQPTDETMTRATSTSVTLFPLATLVADGNDNSFNADTHAWIEVNLKTVENPVLYRENTQRR
jgi:hypothetical protein